jgi:hypothetical protein
MELAQKTGLEYLHFEAFELPSKFIHPTYFGTHRLSRESPGPRHNTLKATHALAIEMILAPQPFQERSVGLAARHEKELAGSCSLLAGAHRVASGHGSRPAARGFR